MVTRLVFNLGFENTGKVLNRFEPGFDPLCLQEVRQSLEKESKVRPGMPAADFKVFDREGKETVCGHKYLARQILKALEK